MQARGLVYPLDVSQTMWFDMPVVSSAKQKLVEHSIKVQETRNGNDVLRGFMLEEAPMRHIKLPLAKGGFLLRDEKGWLVLGLGLC